MIFVLIVYVNLAFSPTRLWGAPKWKVFTTSRWWWIFWPCINELNADKAESYIAVLMVTFWQMWFDSDFPLLESFHLQPPPTSQNFSGNPAAFLRFKGGRHSSNFIIDMKFWKAAKAFRWGSPRFVCVTQSFFMFIYWSIWLCEPEPRASLMSRPDHRLFGIKHGEPPQLAC